MNVNKKWINLIFIGVGTTAWFIVRQTIDTVMAIMRVTYGQDWTLMPCDIAGLVAAVIVFIAFLRSKRINEFTSEVIIELQKVTWPPKKETILSTGVVSVVVIICSMILFFYDILWGTIVDKLYQ